MEAQPTTAPQSGATVADTNRTSKVRVAVNRVSACFVQGHQAQNIPELDMLGIGPPTADGGRRDQENLNAAIRSLGVELIELCINQHLGDACFVQDTVLLLKNLRGTGYVLVELRPGDPCRLKEVSELFTALGAHVEHRVRWKGEGCVEGGDILLPLSCDKDTALLPVGVRRWCPQDSRNYSVRTNHAGILSLSELILPFGYKVRPFEFQRCLHASSRMWNSLDEDGQAVLVADPRSLTNASQTALERFGMQIHFWPEELFHLAWFGVNAPFIDGKRICSDIPEVLEFYESRKMQVDARVQPKHHIAGMQGSGTCLMQVLQPPLGHLS